MFKRSLVAAALFTAATSSVQALPYGFFDARSVAMGNASVATGGITTAALSNPGMLRVNESDDTFAMLIPAIGVQVIDDGNVVDLVDEFQDLEQNPTVDNVLRQTEILLDLTDASVIVGADVNSAFVYSGDSFTWGITARATGVIAAGLENVTGINPPTSNPDGDLVALGVIITEVGVPIGTDVSLAGMQVSFGITPKLVQVDAIDYSESLSTVDIDDLADKDEEDLGSFTTFDAGVTVNVLDTLRVGLVAKNLLEETKTTSAGSKIDFDTHLRAGAAFDVGFMTIAADMDLTERDPIGSENPSQSVSVGAEFDAFSIAQLRAGYQTNIASGSTDPDLFSVGMGFWLGFHVDVAAVVGDDSSLGVFAQTGFRF